MKIIDVGHGRIALVDDQDYDMLCKFSWHASKRTRIWYAQAYVSGKNQYMHRIILGPGNYVTDHKNGCGLDNRRENLRKATVTLNQVNSRKRLNTTSRFKGVCYAKSRNRWMAEIQIFKKRKFLGFHRNEMDAALAYNKAAKEGYGEFARLNIL